MSYDENRISDLIEGGLHEKDRLHFTAIKLIAEERQRQIEDEGFTIENDSQYKENELAFAAAAYALPDELRTEWQKANIQHRSNLFPWSKEYWKPTPNDRVRELVKAAALIAAAIDVELNKQPCDTKK